MDKITLTNFGQPNSSATLQVNMKKEIVEHLIFNSLLVLSTRLGQQELLNW